MLGNGYNIFSMGTLERAVEIAREAHLGQSDPYGEDYILHPLRVMAMGRTEDEKTVGILHDVVEDTHWTLDELKAEGSPTGLWVPSVR